MIAMTELEEKVRQTVSALVDSETGMALGEMKLIRQLKEEDPGTIKIQFKPSNPLCPIALKLALEIKKAALKIEGVNQALVYCQGHINEEMINRTANSSSLSSAIEFVIMEKESHAAQKDSY
jgi:metal-sulfur cluster biosynthetic enzyme